MIRFFSIPGYPISQLTRFLFFSFWCSFSLLAAPSTDSLFRALSSADDRKKIELYYQLSEQYSINDRRTAIRFGREGLALARKFGAIELEAKLLESVAASLVAIGDYKNAVAMANECFSLYDTLGQDRGRSLALNIMGNSYYKTGDYDSSYYYYHRALLLREKIGDIDLIGSSCNNIGMLYINMEMYNDAMRYFQRSIEAKKKAKNYPGIIRTLSNVALIYYKKEEYDSAKSVYRVVYDSSSRISFAGGVALGALGIGGILTREKKYEDALEYFLQAEKILNKTGDINGVLQSRMNIGRVYAKMNRDEKAIKILRETFAAAAASGARSRAKESASVIAEIYLKQKNYVEAYRYSELKRKYVDSISIDNLAKEAVKVQYLARKESHDRAKKILTNRQTIQTLKIERNNFAVGILSAGLIAVIATIAGLSLRHRSILRNKTVLEKKNLAIEEQENELERVVAQLQESLAHVKTLSGFLPICGSCKKIRDDDGYWRQVESYVARRTDATFSHGICPDCVAKLYPDVALKRVKRDQG